jgi:hypothetical protein
MRSSVWRAIAAAAGLVVVLAPNASASWWDGGYGGGQQDVRRHRPPGESPSPGREQPPPQSNQPGGSSQPPESSQPGNSYQPPESSQPPESAQPPGCDCSPTPSCGQPSPCGQPPAPAPAPPPAPPGSIYGCENSDLPGTRTLLHKETTPPEGTPVRPGDEILVDITWNVHDWVTPDLHKALDCVYINNRYVPGLSGGERPTPNDGHFAWRFVVPPDVPDGATICDHGFVSGPNGAEDYAREISNVVCFPVGPPPPPAPAPTTTTTEQPPEAARIGQEVPTTAAPAPASAPGPAQLARHEDVLPRTGGGPGGARLATTALGLALLGGAATRRRRRPGSAE